MIPSAPVQTRQTSVSQTVAPPVGGLNGRDPLADMGRTDAYVMDNAIPGTATVKSRKGCDKFSSTSLGAPVLALEVYTGGAGDRLLAWAADKIYDVSSSVPSIKKSGLTPNLIAITAMFSNAADNAQHMIMVNGQNTPMRYDGTTVTDLAITGVTGSPSQLAYVMGFKGRLYFAQRERLGFYYLAPGAIQGAATYFDLGQVSALGGELMAIGSFSMGDSGDTANDFIVFVTSKGECIVYAGYDPSDIDAWEIVGRYYTAEPIGRRCLTKFGTDMLILTLDGAVPFSEVRKAGVKNVGTLGAQYKAITAKLGNYLSDLNINKAVAGWQGLQYQSEEGWLLFNAPATTSIAGRYVQFVMNTQTNAWCRFTNWDGICFTVFNGRLYFGRYDGWVMLADEGNNDDNGASITFNIKTAYNYFEDGSGLGMLQKHFQWANLMISCDGQPAIDGKFNVDFQEEMPQYITTLPDDGGAEWDEAVWDVAEWGGEAVTQRFVIDLNKGGFCGALWLRASLNGLTFNWYSTQYVMQKTRGLLI